MAAVAQVVMSEAGQAAVAAWPAEEKAQWYVVSTMAHHEKRVAQQFEQQGIEYFLPLYRSVRRWTDRKKELQLPLFPGYIFVHAALPERVRILRVAGVAQFVSFNGLPVPVPKAEIEALQGTLRGSVCVEPHPYLKLGRRVRVHSGPMAGLEGILTSQKGRLRVVLSMDLIMRSLAVEVGTDEIAPLR